MGRMKDEYISKQERQLEVISIIAELASELEKGSGLTTGQRTIINKKIKEISEDGRTTEETERDS